ncbi:uncharacterized protein PHACADRAFT_92890 [Phanerochaete carnosa HHB-10118-sp]|uniref:Alpha/beta hydrolase fold-3 domain-containing protein n=1 Tax=Phanerochaete carnosa (strain HHB-10118-sp) TaxID=650164 RepID=K5V2X9_PHACS|nr:uncharacterized protein PHACADRAFT_92890 [Phanerochaete carnosa HHB-10118-sp]EKM56906.1 hypothetical protein PHACADRAFT_92890 [Phanerochaete carnosa HHB-10118-sp]
MIQAINQLVWRHEPLKTIYLIFALASALVRVPFWFTFALVPPFRPRASWTIGRTVVVKLARAYFTAIFNTGSFQWGRVDPQRFAKNEEGVGLVWIDVAPDLIQGDIKKYARTNKVSSVHVPAYWYGDRDTHSKAGGWVLGDASPVGMSAPMVNDMLSHYHQFSRLLNVEYRLASSAPWRTENPFPAALIDAITAYNYLINELHFRPQNVMVVGESAGGTLGVQLVRYIVESKLPNLPPPGGMLLLSPSMDWGKTFAFGPGSSYYRNEVSDWVQPFSAGYSGRALLGYLPPSEAQLNAWISPASTKLGSAEGLFKGFPPTLIFAGGAEMTYDAMRLAYERIKADTGEEMTVFVELPDATHITLSLPWHDREKEAAYQAMAPWVNAHF